MFYSAKTAQDDSAETLHCNVNMKDKQIDPSPVTPTSNRLDPQELDKKQDSTSDSTFVEKDRSEEKSEDTANQETDKPQDAENDADKSAELPPLPDEKTPPELPEKPQSPVDKPVPEVPEEPTDTAELPEKETEKLEKKKTHLEELQDIAERMYSEQFVLINPEEYTQFLAADDPDLAMIRKYYMNCFKWDKNLLKATRTLCQKLYLKGESQEIDRILSAFTKLYIVQHPVNVFCTRDFEKIYIILYSLILLNTALHNLELNKRNKISHTDYVRNTFQTFLQLDKKSLARLSVRQKISIERELHAFYEDLASHELYLKQSGKESKPHSNSKRMSVAETIRLTALTLTASNADEIRQHEHNDLSKQMSNNSAWSVDNDDRRSSLGILRKMSGASTMHEKRPASAGRVGFTRVLLSDSRNSAFRQKSSLGHKTSRASILSRDLVGHEDQLLIVTHGLNLQKIDFAFEGQKGCQMELEDFDGDDFQDEYDQKLELDGAPYLKEGLLKLRIQHNDQADGENTCTAPLAALMTLTKSLFFSFFSRKKEPEVKTTLGTSNSMFAKFTEYFVVVSKGELRLYSFDPKLIKKLQKAAKKCSLLPSEDDIGDGNWLKNAANVGNYNLCATVALLDTLSVTAKSNKVQWTLTFPKTLTKKHQKKFIFEAGTPEIANEFVSTCMYWASRITAVPPLEESVSSIEYGWTNLDRLINLGDNFKKTEEIKRWEQLPRGVYLSNYVVVTNMVEDKQYTEGLLKQFILTVKYYNHLKKLFNQFSQTRTAFLRGLRKYANTANYKLAAANYEARSFEYRAELAKYKLYLMTMAFGLKLRFDLEQSDHNDLLRMQILEEAEQELSEEEILDELEKRKIAIEADELPVVREARKEIYKMSQAEVPKKEEEVEQLEDELANPLVKLPKTFSLANMKEDESSPISQLLSAETKRKPEPTLNRAKKELIMSFLTNTIREEDETEDVWA